MGDFVLIKNTLRKHVEEALEENRRFREAIQSDTDPFVQDVRNDDPLAFVLRGALHLEEGVSELLTELSIQIPKRSDFNSKIELLSTSGQFPIDGIHLLHKVRRLRNAVAHELDAGRRVSLEAVGDLKANLASERLERLAKICGADPMHLEADVLTRLVMNNLHTELEGTKRRLRWAADYRRIRPRQTPSNTQP